MSGVRPSALVLDVNDLDGQSAFWSALLDMQVTSREDDWLDLGPLAGAGPVLSLQRVPERKAVKNRLHLDLSVDDFAAAAVRAAELGARPASERHGSERPWQVFADPEGNEFCLVTAG